MKYFLTILFACAMSVAIAQPVAVLSTGSAEITSGTISRDDLLSVKTVVVTDAENPGTSYKIVSMNVYHQPKGGNLSMAALKNENISSFISRIDESQDGRIEKGDQIVITDITVKEGDNAEIQTLSNGIVLKVD